MADTVELGAVNPAFARPGEDHETVDVGDASWETARRVLLPLGWTALLALPDRSPLYLLAAEPPSSYDLARTAAQLRAPYAVIVSMPRSPGTIALTLSSGGVSLTDGEGRTLLPEEAGAYRPRTPLDAGNELRVLRWSGRNVGVDLSVASSAQLLRLDVNENLRGLLEGDPPAPGTRYAAESSSVADVALAPSVTAFHQVRRGARSVTFAGRAVEAITLARGEFRASTAVTTDSAALPAGTEISYEGVYWYPGTGAGAGIRLDAGVAVRSRSLTVGLGLRHLFGAWAGRGQGLGEMAGPVVQTYVGSRIVPTLSLVHRVRADGETVAWAGSVDTFVRTLASVSYDEQLMARAGVVVQRRPVELRAGLTIGPQVAFGTGLAVSIGSWIVEGGVTVRESWMPGTPTVGVYGGVGRL